MLWRRKSLISGQENQDLLLLSSHEPDHTGVGRPTHERHPITGVVSIDGQDNLKGTTAPRATTYQTKFIDIGVLAQVLGQTPVGHPRVHKGERRGVGTEPEETGYIWMSQSLPHDRAGTQSLGEPEQKTESIGGILERRGRTFLKALKLSTQS